MPLTYIFFIAIILIAIIGLILKISITRKKSTLSTEIKKNSTYPEVSDKNYFTNQQNKTIDYITRIDPQKFKIVLLPSKEPTEITVQTTHSRTTNRIKNNSGKVDVKPDTLDFHLSESLESLHQLLLGHPHVEILRKEILKDEKSLFNLNNLTLLIVRTLNIKLKNTNDTISYPRLILEVKHYLNRGNLLLENLDKITSVQSNLTSQP